LARIICSISCIDVFMLREFPRRDKHSPKPARALASVGAL